MVVVEFRAPFAFFVRSSTLCQELFCSVQLVDGGLFLRRVGVLPRRYFLLCSFRQKMHLPKLVALVHIGSSCWVMCTSPSQLSYSLLAHLHPHSTVILSNTHPHHPLLFRFPLTALVVVRRMSSRKKFSESALSSSKFDERWPAAWGPERGTKHHSPFIDRA